MRRSLVASLDLGHITVEGEQTVLQETFKKTITVFWKTSKMNTMKSYVINTELCGPLTVYVQVNFE